jgi:hypothetical protein
MSKQIRKFSEKLFFITLILILVSAFTTIRNEPQQATTPTPTATLPGDEAQSVSDSQESDSEPTATPIPASDSIQAYSAFTPTPLPEISSYKEQASFTFRNMGEETFVMHFPSIHETVLTLPNQWNVAYPQSYLEIHYDLFEDHEWEHGRPLVEVYVNEYLAGVFAPQKGKNHIARIDLPYLLFEDRPFNFLNAYTITFQYIIGEGDAFNEDWCDYEGVLTITSESTLNIVFDEIGVRRSLEFFPRPLVQDSFLPETLHFILPDDYTESDLAALATTASAIGRGTDGNVRINVIAASQATNSLLADTNAVVIGRPENNTFIKNLYDTATMPTELSVDGSKILGIDDNDAGVLQLIASPQNIKYSYLIVTGNSELGLMRAAQALSDPPIGMAGVVFVVTSDLALTPESNEKEFTRSFSELGFEDRIVYGIGRSQNFVSFFVPRDWEIQDDARIVLNYAHSAGMSYSHSAMNIYLNDVPIADAIIDERIGEKQIEIPLKPAHVLVGNQNIIRIETVIEQRLECAPYDQRSVWMMVRESSALHLPYSKITSDENLPPIAHPLNHLVMSPEILFSLGSEPSKKALDSIANLSFVLGRRLLDIQTGYKFAVNLDSEFEPDEHPEASLVLVGMPTKNDSIVRINDALPQPFVEGENALTPKQFMNKYRIQEDISIGLIQALPAPWNPFKLITVITGTTDEGFDWALDAAVDDGMNRAMAGDIVFVRGDVAEAFQSSAPVRASLDTIIADIAKEEVVLEEIQPTETTTAQAASTTEINPERYIQDDTSQQRTSMGDYVIYGLVFAGVIVAIGGLVRTMQGGRKR